MYNTIVKHSVYFLTVCVFFYTDVAFTSQPSDKTNIAEPLDDLMRVLGYVQSLDENVNTIDKTTQDNTKKIQSVADHVNNMFPNIANTIETHIASTNAHFTDIKNTYSTKVWTEDLVKNKIAEFEENILNKRLDKQDQQIAEQNKKFADIEARVNQKNTPNSAATVDLSKYISKGDFDAKINNLYTFRDEYKKDKDNSNFSTRHSIWEFASQNKVGLALITENVVAILALLYFKRSDIKGKIDTWLK